MNYRIEQREAFRVFGVFEKISTDHETAFLQVPQFCRKCGEDGTAEEMNRLLGRFGDNFTIAALYDFTETDFKYMLCQYLPEGLTLPSRFSTLDVPAATWAIFDAPECEVQDVWRRIWSEWFPSSEYETAEGPQFEMYYGLGKHQNGFGEIWVPVRKK